MSEATNRDERQTIIPSDESSSLREPLLALGQSLHESSILMSSPRRRPPITTSSTSNNNNESSSTQSILPSGSQNTSDESQYSTPDQSRASVPDQPPPPPPETSAAVAEQNRMMPWRTLNHNAAATPAAPPTLSSSTSASELRRRTPHMVNGDSSEQQSSFTRILDRDANFHQSRGRWQVLRRSRGVHLYHGRRIRRVYDDWFHSLAYKPTLVLMGILFLMYTACVFFFAFVYLGVSLLGETITKTDDGSITTHSFCGMDITNHMEALYFSLSTMTTIGYGVSDYYFGDCWTPLILVLWQSCTSITFSAVAIGLLFQRISRGQKRGKSIVFSDKAVIRRVRGVPYLMFRVGELRRHHLIEATVRAYCLIHERIPIGERLPHTNDSTDNTATVAVETTHFLTRQLRLIHPDETIGPTILMGIPQMIVHRLDESSPLCPSRPVWLDGHGHKRYWRRHEDLSVENEGIREYLRDREVEIVILLEGSDELTGSALQSRHSYRVEDIVWNHTFAPCVFPADSVEDGNDNGREGIRVWCGGRHCDRVVRPACLVDFSKFHDLVPAPSDCDSCAYVPENINY